MMVEQKKSTPFAKTETQNHRRSSFINSLLLGFVVFAILMVLLEGFSHTKYGARAFKVRSVGSYHTQFELKWFALQDYVEKNHGVDVVLLGNSMVNTGIDPLEFEERYQSLSGQKLRVFNFGVEGLSVEPLSFIAELISQRYHPGTIILFTEMRDYIAGNGDQVTKQFYDNPWIQYQMGIPNIEGYLIEHSAFFPYLLTWRNWSSPEFIDSQRTISYRKGNMNASGYEPDRSQTVFEPQIPDPNDPAEKENFELARNFKIDPTRALHLQGIISLIPAGTHVIVTEMPVYPTYYVYFGPVSVRLNYLADLQKLVKDAGGVFVPAIPESEIPLSGRVDNHHLNATGAPIYSELLANHLYFACENQSTCIYPASTDLQP
jgi:hypothetical protein